MKALATVTMKMRLITWALTLTVAATISIENSTILSFMRDSAFRSNVNGDCYWKSASFNVKIYQRMHFDRRQIWPIVTNKAGAKVFASLVGVPVVPTYWETGKLTLKANIKDKIAQAQHACHTLPPMSSLPSSFAFKAVHTSQCNLLIVDGVIIAHKACTQPERSKFQMAINMFLGKKIPKEAKLGGQLPNEKILRKSCERWLSQQYYRSRNEWAYQDIAPGLQIEAILFNQLNVNRNQTRGKRNINNIRNKRGLLRNKMGLASDLKCYTASGGVTRYIHVVLGRFGESQTDTFFFAEPNSTSWRPLLQVRVDSSTPEMDPRRHPSNEVLNRARKMCGTVGKYFDFLRVDLLWSLDADYSTSSKEYRNWLTDDTRQGIDGGELYLGEMTPYPGGGGHKFTGTPDLNVELSRGWCPFYGS